MVSGHENAFCRFAVITVLIFFFAKEPWWPSLQASLLHLPHLQLLFIKVAQPLQWHHFVEAVQERFGLLLDTTGEPPIGQQAEGQNGSKFLLAGHPSHQDPPHFRLRLAPFLPVT